MSFLIQTGLFILRLIGGFLILTSIIGFIVALSDRTNASILICANLVSLSLGIYLVTRKGQRKPDVQYETAKELGETILSDLQSGNFKAVRPSSAILRKDEVAFLAIPAALLENKTVSYAGGGTSVRVRVAKGVSIGQQLGRARAVKSMVPVAHGEFVVTNNRIIFAGDKKSFDTNLEKLTNVQPYSDGMAVHYGPSSRIVTFDSNTLAVAANTIVKLAIEGQLSIESSPTATT